MEYPPFDNTRHHEDDRLSVWCNKENLDWLHDLKNRIDISKISSRKKCTVKCEIVCRDNQKFALFLVDHALEK